MRREPDDAVHAQVPRNPPDELLEGPADARGAAHAGVGPSSSYPTSASTDPATASNARRSSTGSSSRPRPLFVRAMPPSTAGLSRSPPIGGTIGWSIAGSKDSPRKLHTARIVRSGSDSGSSYRTSM